MTDKTQYKTIGVRVTKDLSAQLDELAAAEQRSVSQIIRFALEAYISTHKKDQ